MGRLFRGYINTSLIVKITIALILGIITGLVFGEGTSVLSPLGDLLMRLLQFIIIPLIFFTLIVGVNQTKLGNLGRMGGKMFLYYAVTSALAIVVGLLVANLFEPGSGITVETSETVEANDYPGVASVLLNIIPSNIVTAFSEMNLLGIIFTSLVFGIAISAIRNSDEHGELGEHVYKLFNGLNEATFKVMNVILQIIPIGIFAIIAQTVGNQGINTILELGNMVLVLYVAILVQIVLYTILMITFKMSPREFFSQARTPMITAFVTQSSSGTLPVTLNAANRLGLSKSLYGFSLPLGATMNMDGAAIRIAVSAVFAANYTDTTLGFTGMLMIVIVGTLASIGTAGVPGAGIVMIATVFTQVGLPMEAVAVLTSIDVLVGMGATALNVTGDLVGTSIVNQSEKKHQTEASA
ncbi:MULTISPECIES: dicarboxylate/amino acid:cation symporter [Pontibacillus]|uniref:Dicarboxylate/amino acid:cation symporter n=1 Tax=Pontibacillus chungwhensis TaxID=265426 RepID=A0ABY8UUY4_9BACI|nr:MULTISPECIES: dicarboxylate/amino acid:cation symporter [Pontibacillus]MCD5325239.1 dicarboxylate/amino acid:cation symporter [Pontibacillus sp. HN14]WIF97487.1 dicarboxylate/amino acid:cation symporter [Pontibacillus chungwhensis]